MSETAITRLDFGLPTPAIAINMLSDAGAVM